MSNSNGNINMTEEDLAEVELLKKAIEEKKKAPKTQKKPVSRGNGGTDTGPASEVIRPSRVKKVSRKKTSNAPLIIMLVAVIAAIGGGFYYYSLTAKQPVSENVPEKPKTRDNVSGLEGGVRVAVVFTVKGDMQVNNTGEFKNAIANMTNIIEDATIKTGSDSFGCISVSGALVYLDANTTLKMGKNKMAGPSGAALTVTGGRIYVQTEGDGGYDKVRVSAAGKIIYGAGAEYIVYSSGTVAAAKGTAYIKTGGSETTVPEMKTSAGGDISESDHSWMHAQGARYALSSKVSPDSAGTGSAGASGSDTAGNGTGSSYLEPAGFLYEEKYDTSLSAWQIIGGGSWLVQRGAQINHTSDEARGILLLKNKSAKFFRIHATVNTGRQGAIGFVFGYSPGSFHLLRWTASGRMQLVKVSGGIETSIVDNDYEAPPHSKDIYLELWIDNSTIRLFNNNQNIFRHPSTGLPSGNVGLLSESNPDAVFTGITVDARKQDKPSF